MIKIVVVIDAYRNSSIKRDIARSPDPSTSGRSGEPSYKTIVTPLAKPETSQCHLKYLSLTWGTSRNCRWQIHHPSDCRELEEDIPWFHIRKYIVLLFMLDKGANGAMAYAFGF